MASPTPAKLLFVEDTPITEKLWNKFKKERTHVLYTPFMVSLISRTLDLDAFLHFVSQSIHVLRAYDKVYQMAEEFSDDDVARVEVCKLRKSILDEIKLHDSYLQTLDLDLDIYSTPNAATIKYTDFLLAAAHGKVEGVKVPGNLADTTFEKTKLPAFIVGVMTVRMSLYAFLGRQIHALLDPSNGIHPNQEWIDNITSDSFQAQDMQTDELLEKLCVSLTEDELDYIEKLSHQAMKFEVELFLAPPLLRKTIVPMCQGPNPAGRRFMLFCSFDLTCTVFDSFSTLAELAIAKASVSDQAQAEASRVRMSSANLRTMWDQISDLYADEYQKCMESILAGDKKEQFGYQGLGKASQIISAFEKKANLRVRSLELLKGLTVDDVKEAGELMTFQDGCMDFFHRAINDERLKTNIHIISYCWSDDMIESAFSSGGLDVVKVQANRLIYKDSISTGKVSWRIQSPIDKVKTVKTILESYRKGPKNMTVYIGDTVSDFLCLLGAHCGIVIGSNPSLRRLGAHFGVTFLPLLTYVVEEQERFHYQRDPLERKLLFTVSSWAEIHAFFLGY